MGRKQKYEDDQTRLESKRQSAMRSYWKHKNKRKDYYLRKRDAFEAPTSETALPNIEKNETNAASQEVDMSDVMKQLDEICDVPAEKPGFAGELPKPEIGANDKDKLAAPQPKVDDPYYVTEPTPEVLQRLAKEREKYPNTVIEEDGETLYTPAEDEIAYAKRMALSNVPKKPDRRTQFRQFVNSKEQELSTERKLKEKYVQYKQANEPDDFGNVHVPMYEDDAL